METQMEQNVQLISEMIKNVAYDVVPMICIFSLLVSCSLMVASYEQFCDF
jgi:hypothetical protein